MKKRVTLLLMVFMSILLIVTACVPGDGSYTSSKPANFLSGIWHGWIAPFSLIAGLFKGGIRIYEPINTGWWYDLGFYAAIISGFGGLSLTRDKRKNRD